MTWQRSKQRRTAALGSGVLCILAAIATAQDLKPPAAQHVAPTHAQLPPREPGVRLRLYDIDAAPGRLVRMAPDQSPNLDLTIGSFRVDGGEPWLAKHRARYVAQFDSQLTVDHEGEHRFELASASPAELRIDGRAALAATGRTGPRPTVAIRLTAGVHDVEVLQCVGDESPELSLLWAGPKDETLAAIPPAALKAAAFVFRPTQPGVKTLLPEGARPGLGLKVSGVHPALELATLHPADVELPVGGLDCLPDGRLVVAVFDARRLRAPRPQPEPDGELWLLEGVEGPAAAVTRTRIAQGLYEPAGVAVVGPAIYVSQRSEVTRFDFDSSSGKWRPTTVATGWETNDFHALSFGLAHEPGPAGSPGYLYMARGTGLGLFQNPPNHGSVWRIDLSRPPGANVEPITGGHRTPNGLGVGPQGALFVTDNQGEWTPANELNHVQPGRFYGFYHRTGPRGSPSPFQPTEPGHPDAVTEAAVWLPQDEIANSPSEPIMIPAGWPFAGQMLVGDVKYGGVNRISLEQVGGAWQGAAYRFTQGLEGGVNRLTFSAAGSLFAGCIGGDHASTWNWVDPQGRSTYQGLQRLRPSGRPYFDLEEVSLTPDGLRVAFTQPVPAEWLADVANFRLEQWTYAATAAYGGAKLEEEPLAASAAQPSADRRAVSLSIAGLKPNRVVHLTADARSEAGEEIWSAEAWYTLRRLKRQAAPVPPNAAEAAAQ
jgi:hypothetical protein